jgi:hypothetical protein
LEKLEDSSLRRVAAEADLQFDAELVFSLGGEASPRRCQSSAKRRFSAA